MLDECSGLYYFNARWYDSEMGRFITQDPARDGVNWYGYCGQDPVVYVDSDGKTPVLSLTLEEAIKIALTKGAPKLALAAADGPSPIVDIAVTIWLCYDVYQICKNYKASESNSSNDSESKANTNNTAGASAGTPSPDPDDGNNSNEDYYESNPKHHKNAKGKASEEPKNAKEMFDKFVEDSSKPNTRWYKDKNGNFHRFQGSNHKYHWNGSTDTGTRLDNVPIEIRRNLPLGDI